MYTFLRKTHLYAGLVILLFLLMYFVSGYVLIHNPWFRDPKSKPAPLVRSESLADYTGPRTPEALADYLVDRFDLNGRLTIPPADKQPPNAIRFSVQRPGTSIQVSIPHSGDTATITTNREDWVGTLVQMHRLHAYGGGWLFNLFILFNDLASFSCILFALTGVYLWWKTVTRHAWGFICLGLSCAYGAGMILYMLYSR